MTTRQEIDALTQQAVLDGRLDVMRSLARYDRGLNRRLTQRASRLRRRLRAEGMSATQIRREVTSATRAALAAEVPHIEAGLRAATAAGVRSGAMTFAAADAVVSQLAGEPLVIASVMRSARRVARDLPPVAVARLSPLLSRNATATARAASATITTSIRSGQSAVQAADALLGASDPITHLPRYVTDLRSAMRGSPIETRRAIRDALASARRLGTRNVRAATTIRNSAHQLIEAAESGSEAALERQVNYFIRDRARYQAQRVARTEMSRAYTQAYVRSTQHPAVKGYQWNLSTSHPAPDECDVYGSADTAGLGGGVYPPDASPQMPAHPQCLCYFTSVMRSPAEIASGNDAPLGPTQSFDEYVGSQSQRYQESVLGPGRARELRRGRPIFRPGGGSPRPLYEVQGRPPPTRTLGPRVDVREGAPGGVFNRLHPREIVGPAPPPAAPPAAPPAPPPPPAPTPPRARRRPRARPQAPTVPGLSNVPTNRLTSAQKAAQTRGGPAYERTVEGARARAEAIGQDARRLSQGNLLPREEVRLRRNVRGVVRAQSPEAISTDVAAGLEHAGSIRPQSMASSNLASHSSYSGRVWSSEATSRRASVSLRQLAERGTVDEGIKGFHTLVHEELHGFSPKAGTARGIGRGLEEATVEIRARQITAVFVEDAGAARASLPSGSRVPVISITERGAVSITEHAGSYGGWVNRFYGSVARATGLQGEALEEFMEHGLRRHFGTDKVVKSNGGLLSHIVRSLAPNDLALRARLRESLRRAELGREPFRASRAQGAVHHAARATTAARRVSSSATIQVLTERQLVSEFGYSRSMARSIVANSDLEAAHAGRFPDAAARRVAAWGERARVDVARAASTLEERAGAATTRSQDALLRVSPAPSRDVSPFIRTLEHERRAGRLDQALTGRVVPRGWFRTIEPIEIIDELDDAGRIVDTWIQDGNHRLSAALDVGADRIAVRHIRRGPAGEVLEDVQTILDLRPLRRLREGGTP